MKPLWFSMEEILVGKANAMLIKRPFVPWGRSGIFELHWRTFMDYGHHLASIPTPLVGDKNVK